MTTHVNQGQFIQQMLQSPKRSLWWTTLKFNLSQICTRKLIILLTRKKFLYYASVLAMVYNDSVFLLKTWFSDNSIHLKSFIDWQKTHFLSFELSNAVLQNTLHNQLVILWCAITVNDILGPYFVGASHENPVTVNQEWYRQKNYNTIFKESENSGMHEPCHFECDGFSRMEPPAT